MHYSCMLCIYIKFEADRGYQQRGSQTSTPKRISRELDTFLPKRIRHKSRKTMHKVQLIRKIRKKQKMHEIGC